MLRPYPCVDDPNDYSLPGIALPARCRPHGSLDVDELRRIRILCGYHPVALHVSHVLVLLQPPHLAAGQLGSKGVCGEGVTAGQEGRGGRGEVGGEGRRVKQQNQLPLNPASAAY